MNVQQLIDELKLHPPHKPVRVVISSVYWDDEGGAGEMGLTLDDATEADDVSNQGGYVLIRGL